MKEKQMSKFYKVLLIRTLTTERVIEVDDEATEEDILDAARDQTAELENRDFDEADSDAEILAENLQQMV
jgi:hypothetical protein